jgi:hypothetical protein
VPRVATAGLGAIFITSRTYPAGLNGAKAQTGASFDPAGRSALAGSEDYSMKKAGLLAAMRRGGRAGAVLFDEVVSRASGALTPAAPPTVTLQRLERARLKSSARACVRTAI